MAHGVKWWFGGTVLACLVIAASYLPPRGTQGVMSFMSIVRWGGRGETEAVQRRNELANQWRNLSGQLDAARLRKEAEEILAAERAAGRPPRALVLDSDSLTEARRRILQPAFDSVWNQLRLGNTKIAVVLASPPSIRSGDVPPLYGAWRTYLLPDSTDRTTCIIVYPLGGLVRDPPRPQTMQQRLRSSLGPCAFYAKFGAPSARVRRWLDAGNYDLAESADWSGIRRGRDYDDGWNIVDTREFGTYYFYSYVYEMEFTKIACVAGRVAACVEALNRGDRLSLAPYRRVVNPSTGWRISDSRLPDEVTTLAAVANQAGDDAFQQFWTTSLPIDSALTLALGKPAGEWLTERPEAKRMNLRLGPVPPTHSMVQSVLLSLAMLGIAVVLVQRRQVK